MSSLLDASICAEAPAQLLDAVSQVKAADRLAPVTIICPSGYSALFVRRALATSVQADGCAGIANVNATSVETLLETLGSAVLASRGLRVTDDLFHLEALRTEALSRGDWLGRFAAQPRALCALGRTLRELETCPPATLDVVSASSFQAAQLVDLMRAVRRRLHRAGFADSLDVAGSALEAAQSGCPQASGLGTVLTWELGPCSNAEAVVLRRLHVERIDPGTGRGQSRRFDEVRSFPDAEEEARAAVRAVVEAAEQGVHLWRQAIFLPPGSNYVPLVLEHLASASVAANGPGTRPLASCATARAVLGLLELSTGEWERDHLIAWLSTSPLCTAPGGRLVPATSWDLLSASAGVIRGEEQWAGRLALHAERSPHDHSEALSLSDFVGELADRCRPPDKSWREHSRWLLGLLDHYLDPKSSPTPWPAEEIAAAAQVRRIVSSLGDLDELSGGTDPVAFRTAIEVQLCRTSPAAHGDAGKFDDGVFVAPFSVARGLRFSQVIACGLADAIVPGAGTIDALLSEDARRSDTSGTLRTRSSVNDQLREDLVCVIGAGTTRRVATLPRCDPRSGRSHIASRWLEALGPHRRSWMTTDSFAAVLKQDGTVLSLRELELRAMDRWVGCGGHASASPVARSDERLAAGFDALLGRQASAFTRFDGFVGAGRASPFDPRTPVSATRLETYAHCPRRYLFERTLGVRRRVLPEELWQMEPVERGSLMHSILEDYVSERVEGAERCLERLLGIAQVHLGRAEAGGLVGKSLLWRIDRSAILRDLRRFHAEEGDLRPVAVELAFGSTDDDVAPPLVVSLDDGRKVHFRGSADRVDVSASGRLVVSDYKTGKQSGLAGLLHDPVASGTLLQLPLYGLAARERFGSTAPVHTRYWLLSSERSTSFYNLELTQTVEDRFRQVVGLITSGVEAGCFPSVPGAAIYDGRFENCSRCDFDDICPPQRDREWHRKMRDPLLAGVVDLVHEEADGSWAGLVKRGFVDPDRFDTGFDGGRRCVGDAEK